MYERKLFVPICCLAFVFLFVAVIPVHAASTVSVSPAGGGQFILNGIGMENVAAIDITLAYDSASLANPRATQGSLVAGALMSVNPNVPGTIRIAMVRTSPVTGSGPIATLVFDLLGSSPGRILSLHVKLAGLTGQPLPVVADVVNPAQGTSAPPTGTETPPLTAATAPQAETTPPADTTPPRTTAAAPAPIPILLPGGVIFQPETGTMPQPEVPAPEVPDTIETPQTAMVHEPRTPAGKPENRQESAVRKVHAHMSVLDRFKEYKGAVSIKAFLSFFEQDALLGFSQEPRVVLADGTARARVTFISVPGERSTSEAAVAGAKLISLARDPDYSNTWVADIQPAKGESSASLSIPQGSVIMLYPLSVAPVLNIDLDKSGSVAEADFELYLKDRGAKTPRFDLNGDGKRDYLDDYLFTANYLAGTSQDGKKPKT